MKDTIKVKVVPLNPGEAKMLKAKVYDLCELAVKQTIYGIIQVLSFKAQMSRTMFEEILDDAAKYSEVKKGGDVR